MAIEQTVNKIAQGRSGVICIDAPAGRGKTSMVVRARKMGRGRVKVVAGHALATERGTPYYVFRTLLEAYTGIRPSMTQQECRLVVERMEEGKSGERINIAALSKVLPWIGDAARFDLFSISGLSSKSEANKLTWRVFFLPRTA